MSKAQLKREVNDLKRQIHAGAGGEDGTEWDWRRVPRSKWKVLERAWRIAWWDDGSPNWINTLSKTKRKALYDAEETLQKYSAVIKKKPWRYWWFNESWVTDAERAILDKSEEIVRKHLSEARASEDRLMQLTREESTIYCEAILIRKKHRRKQPPLH